MNVSICLKSRIISEALFELLSRDNDCDLVFAGNSETAETECRPDVIIVDQMNVGTETLSSWPEAKFILLDTGLLQEEIINLMLMHRLHGVISADDDTLLIKKALRLVNEGQIWINNDHLRALLCRAGNRSRHDKVVSISKREHDILGLITQGRKNKEIAMQLFMSEQTVKAHVSHIFRKFNVSSRAQLVSHLMSTPRESIESL